QYSQELHTAQAILTCCSSQLCQSTCGGVPDGTCGGPPDGCDLPDLQSCVEVTDDGTDASIQGRWGIGQSFAEILLLEYENNFTGRELGFGKVKSADDVLNVLPLHTGAFNALQRADYVDWRQGANLLYHLAYAVVNGVDPGAADTANKMLVYVGHDT